ncbi:signal peptide peptidase [Cooperia oncophora]
MDKAKEIEAASSPNSRKTSRNESRKVSLSEDSQQAARLNRLLSDIQEMDTIHSQQSARRSSDAADNDQDRKPAGLSPKTSTESSGESSPSASISRSRFKCTKVEEPKIIFPENVSVPYTGLVSVGDSRGTSRRSSVSGSVARIYAGADEPEEDDSERERNAIYQQIGQTNFFTYSLSALNLLPKNRPGLPVLKLNFSDIWSEFFSVHLPIWACVAAFYIVLLELFGVHFAYYFYYHEEAMVYSALTFSIIFGLFHEFYGGWFTNDILAFSSIYIVCSRVQAVSYQAACILLVGMAIFDVFWLYVVDLITFVVQESRAPLFIMLPRDHRGNKQSLAAIDIIVPGIFLNVIQKYSSMFDPGLFTATYAAIFGALTVTVIFSVWRRKIIPSLALPALVAIVVSMALCTHRNDLWRFMIKYKRTMPPKRM